MFNRVVLGLTLVSLSVGVEVQTVGPEVRVILASGETYNGEILAARDSSIVFSTVHGATDDELAAARGTIRILAHREILTAGVPGFGRSTSSRFPKVLTELSSPGDDQCTVS